MILNPDYEKYLKGRKVAIVGGADNYSTAEINKYDVIVKINNHWLRQRGRCEVLYHTIRSDALRPELLPAEFDFNPVWAWLNKIDWEFEVGGKKQPDIDYFLNACTKHKKPIRIGYFAQGAWAKENPYGPEYEWLNYAHNKYDCILLTGLIALYHVLLHKVKKVFVCGMDMYVQRDPRIERYQGVHWMPGNIRFLQDALEMKPLVELDEPLLKALERYEQESKQSSPLA